MTGWNLPPDVTGSELEISRPDREWRAWAPVLRCPGCGRVLFKVRWQAHRARGAWWSCSFCGQDFAATEEEAQRAGA